MDFKEFLFSMLLKHLQTSLLTTMSLKKPNLHVPRGYRKMELPVE